MYLLIWILKFLELKNVGLKKEMIEERKNVLKPEQVKLSLRIVLLQPFELINKITSLILVDI